MFLCVANDESVIQLLPQASTEKYLFLKKPHFFTGHVHVLFMVSCLRAEHG